MRGCVDNAVSIGRGDLAPLCTAAREHQVTIVCGMTERDDDSSRGTIYNTAVVIGPDGSLRNKHRKLMPTNPERMVWGFGDGSTLNVVDTPCGRIGDDALLGELHAARALRAVRAGRRSLYRADLRQRRRLDRNDAAHRTRRLLLGRRQRNAAQRARPARPIFRTRRGSIRMPTSGSTTAIRSSSRRREESSPDHCAGKPEYCTPTSTSTRSPRRDGASTSPDTTRAPTCSACTSTGNGSRRSASTEGDRVAADNRSRCGAARRSRRRRSRR